MKKTKSNILKIAVVGEHPNHDSDALCHILRPLACENVQFKVILKNKRGGQLDSPLLAKSLESELESEHFDYIIVIRDLDGVLSETKKVKQRDEWFKKLDKSIAPKSIFFLVVSEMEALILADIQTFNRFFNLKTNFSGHPMHQAKAKELLKQFSAKAMKGRYEEYHALDIFKQLNFKTIYTNHCGERSFQAFANDLKNKKWIDFEDDSILSN
jgi:Domain of unknown function (DUF4276)